MTNMEYGQPAWVRILGIIMVGVWYYVVAAQYTFDSIFTLVLGIPLAGVFTYQAIVQLSFLVRGNPPIVEVHDDVVIVRNLFGEKLFERSELSVSPSYWLLWNSLVLSDGTKKATIVNSAEFSERKFEALRSELLP